jgi:hypothetical protein
MVRSGGMQYVSNAIKFVPDLESIPSFAEMASSIPVNERCARCSPLSSLAHPAPVPAFANASAARAVTSRARWAHPLLAATARHRELLL